MLCDAAIPPTTKSPECADLAQRLGPIQQASFVQLNLIVVDLYTETQKAELLHVETRMMRLRTLKISALPGLKVDGSVRLFVLHGDVSRRGSVRRNWRVMVELLMLFGTVRQCQILTESPAEHPLRVCARAGGDFADESWKATAQFAHERGHLPESWRTVSCAIAKTPRP